MLTLSKAIAAASIFTSKEEVRPYLHYIALIPRNEFLLVSATDGKSAFFGKVHLPADFGGEAKLIAATTAKKVKPNSFCYIQGKQLFVDGDCFDLKRDGDDVCFPDVMRVIPRNLSGSSRDGMSCYLLAPAIGSKINKAEKSSPE